MIAKLVSLFIEIEKQLKLNKIGLAKSQMIKINNERRRRRSVFFSLCDALVIRSDANRGIKFEIFGIE